MDIFYDLTVKKDNYDSIFGNDKMYFLKCCHEKYGLKVVLFCFCEFNGFSLPEATGKFLYEFKENSNWLKFGFHAYDANAYTDESVDNLKNVYTLFQTEICRITGSNPEIETCRLDRFTATEEQLALLNSEFGIGTFLGADSYDRDNYWLDKDLNTILIKYDTIKIDGYKVTQTGYRIENPG